MHSPRRLLVLLLGVFLVITAGCSSLDKPAGSTTAPPTPQIDASKILSKERLRSYEDGTPERATLQFIRTLQVRNWFDAYYRLSDPALRSQFTFRRFSRIAALIYTRMFLPFSVQRIDSSLGRRAVIVEVRNPADGAVALDTYEFVRRGTRWFLVFATSLTSADLSLS